MSKLKTILTKRSSIILILILTFLFSTCLRILLGYYCGQMNVFYDELLHWNLSKSVYYGLGSNFRNDMLSYKEILYSIVLSLVHGFGDTKMQYYAAVGINSLLMSSVVFPVYIMSHKFLKRKSLAYLITCMSILLPEMFYTAKILQENLFYPMAVWFFFIFIVFILKEPYRVRNIILLSSYVFLISLCKQMALNIFAGVVLYYIFQFLIFDKENRRTCILSLLLFITVFMGFKISYDVLFNLVNGISKESSAEVTIIVILKNMFDGNLLIELIYPALSYLLLSGLFFGLFTLFLPLSLSKKLTVKERNLFLIIVTTWISTIGVICLRIIPSENLDEVMMRFHFRYMFYLIVPILILFISIYDRVKEGRISVKLLVLSVFYILLLNEISLIPEEGSSIDCVGANYMKYMFTGDMMIKTLHMLIIGGIALCLYLLYKRKVKVLYVFILTCIMATGIINNIYTYSKLSVDKKNSAIKIGDALTLNQYFNSKKDFDWKSLLIVSDKKVSDAKLECFLQRPDYYYAKTEDFTNYIADHEGESFEGLNLCSFNHIFTDEALKYPEYIITNKFMYITGYEKVELNLEKYYLFSRNE